MWQSLRLTSQSLIFDSFSLPSSRLLLFLRFRSLSSPLGGGIVKLFPDNDPKWKGAASDIFMNEAMRLCDEMGYRVSNLDATIIAQRPKLSPHKEIIRDNVAKLLKCDRRLVNIKAKTHEKVDSLGENRSIGCHCVVLLVKK